MAEGSQHGVVKATVRVLLEYLAQCLIDKGTGRTRDTSLDAYVSDMLRSPSSVATDASGHPPVCTPSGADLVLFMKESLLGPDGGKEIGGDIIVNGVHSVASSALLPQGASVSNTSMVSATISSVMVPTPLNFSSPVITSSLITGHSCPQVGASPLPSATATYLGDHTTTSVEAVRKVDGEKLRGEDKLSPVSRQKHILYT
tara:strand:- start:164 stop:766 length:603 start_codon:yes stop_codon:yes gene_type:complete